MGSTQQKIHHIGYQQYQDAYKNSIEESVKHLAQAIHSTLTGGGTAALPEPGVRGKEVFRCDGGQRRAILQCDGDVPLLEGDVGDSTGLDVLNEL